MTENHEDSATSTSGECPKCPTSPPPEFVIPEDPAPAYYEEIPKDKLEALEAARTEKAAAADEEKKKSIATADKTKQTASAAYDAAQMDYQAAKAMLNLKTTNKKAKLWHAFKRCLIDALPKTCAASGDMDIEKVPTDKRAICIAQLKSALANEEVTYLTELRKISQVWLAAASAWKIAEKSYDADLCMADAVEQQSLRAADIEWRNNISKELEKVCK